MTWDGYTQIGIDHFARPEDSLAVAARAGRLRRNFQGYTDDTAPVLIGLGASAISKYPQGYVQNATGTAAYQKAVRAGDLATGRSHRLTAEDHLRARIIEMVMSEFRVSVADLLAEGFGPEGRIMDLLRQMAEPYGDLIHLSEEALVLREGAYPLARLIAREVDAYDTRSAGHSSAI